MKAKRQTDSFLFLFPLEAFFEIPIDHVTLDVESLGSGSFGDVLKGSVYGADVAVKRLKENRQIPAHIQSFKNEISIMKTIQHKNIVQLLYTVTTEYLMIFELLHSSLLAFLEGKDFDRRNLCSTIIIIFPGPEGENAPVMMLLKMSHDVASALVYMKECRILHRDIAARNVLMTKEKTAKLSDFGSAEKLDGIEVYVAQDSILAFRWSAPEVHVGRQFSLQSDIFSFGCLLSEMFSKGRKPYHHIKERNEIRDKIIAGEMPQLPSGAPLEVVSLMKGCLKTPPDERLTIDLVESQLEVRFRFRQ